jgi:hypothetical protein
VRHRRCLAVRRVLTHNPRRDLDQSCRSPSKAQGPFPGAIPWGASGFLHASNAVCVGGMRRPQRANRLGSTARLLRASPAHAPPRTPSSATRSSKPRPVLRGRPACSHHASRTWGRPLWARRGAMPPHGPTPVSGGVRTPASIPPATTSPGGARPSQPCPAVAVPRVGASCRGSRSLPCPLPPRSRPCPPSCTARGVRAVPPGGCDPAARHRSSPQRPAHRALPTASPPRSGPSGPPPRAGRAGVGLHRPARAPPARRALRGPPRGGGARGGPAGALRGVRQPSVPCPRHSPRRLPSSGGGPPPGDSRRRSGGPPSSRRDRDRGRPAPPCAGVVG